MAPALLVSMIVYCFAMSITPGPNNMMLASSGLVFGLKRTLPTLLGVTTGFIGLVFMVGVGLGALLEVVPQLTTVLKFGGVAYLLYLAWKLWRAGEPKTAEAARPVGYFPAIALQFLNPKGWLMAITAIAAFAAPGHGYGWRVALVCLVFTVVGVPCSMSWAAFGATVRAKFPGGQVYIWFNRTMAALTAATAVLILFE